MDNKKMSKSEGNFLTLEDAITEYSADATRLTMANSGDSNEFANFETAVANAAVLELFKLQEKAAELVADENLRTGDLNWFDKMFLGDIEHAANVTSSHFDGMRFREGLKTGFYEFINTRAQYTQLTAAEGMHRDVILKYLNTQAIVLSPLCPHVAEELWKLCGNEGLCADATWPAESNEFSGFHRASVFLTKFLGKLRKGYLKLTKGKKAITPSKAMVYVKDEYSEVQRECLSFLKAQYDANDGHIPQNFKGELQALLTGEKGIDKKAAETALGFASFTAKACEEQGPDVLESDMPYNQTEVLQASAAFIQAEMGLTLEVYDATTDCPDPKKKKSSANPADPSMHIE
jgi:leucyl-tRNA synthetase